MIRAANLTKAYKHQIVLKNVSFSLERGKILGVFGPNGAGKTTLLKILSLIFKPDAGGSLFVNDIDAVQRPQDVRTQIGYVPQEIALYQDLSVVDNLFCWSRQHHLSQQDAVFTEIIKALDIDSILKKKVRKLSGGMKRRVNLAVALMNSPQILVMDEPLVGVDILQRKLIINHLKTLSNRGVTQIITSHYPGELVSFVDHVMMLDEGQMKLLESSAVLEEIGKTQRVPLDTLLFGYIQNKES